MNGKYQIKISIDNSYDVLIEAFNFQGGQYKKFGDRKLEKFCKSLYIEPVKNTYAKFYGASSVKVPFGTCPFPAMDNVISNLMISDNGMLPPYLPGGEKWRVSFNFFKNGEVMGGYNLDVLLRNQQTLMQGW